MLDMARIWRVCFNVSGIIALLMMNVNTIIARPKLLNNMLYNSARLLTIGWMIIKFQISPIIANFYPL